MSFIKRVPLPLSGVALGLAALGNLLMSYSMSLRYFCGILAFVGILLVTCKYLPNLDTFFTDMKNPVLASVFGTYTMTLMLLAGYIKPFVPVLALIIWYGAILGHLALIIYFTMNILAKINIAKDLMKVFASYFIVYVGIVVASVTAPAFENITLGKICFWIGFISFIPLFIYVSLRYIKLGNKNIETKALGCIYAAPGSLCVAGYISSFDEKNLAFLTVLYVFSFVVYLGGLLVAADLFISFYKNRSFKFYPSFAGLTFPFVISAIAGKQFMGVLNKAGIETALSNVLPFIVSIEIIIAVIGVAFSAICFAKAVFFVKAKENALAN